MDLNKYTEDNKFKKCIYEKEKYVRVTNTFLNSRLKKYLHHQNNEYRKVIDSTCQLFDGRNYTSRRHKNSSPSIEIYEELNKLERKKLLSECNS